MVFFFLLFSFSPQFRIEWFIVKQKNTKNVFPNEPAERDDSSWLPNPCSYILPSWSRNQGWENYLGRSLKYNNSLVVVFCRRGEWLCARSSDSNWLWNFISVSRDLPNESLTGCLSRVGRDKWTRNEIEKSQGCRGEFSTSDHEGKERCRRVLLPFHESRC